MKGIVLAGGTGSRLFPLTKITNKHLLPIYDKPMIYYPIQTLVDAGISDIMVVTGGKNSGDFLRLLANGKHFGLKHIAYTYQEGEGGIADALGLCEHFADGQPICVVLGDNIIEKSIRGAGDAFRAQEKRRANPAEGGHRRGTLRRGGIQGDRIIGIEEKPAHPKSNFAVTGIYMYDATVFEKIKTCKPSHRNELEITDVNNAYIREGTMTYSFLDGWWTDAGTFDSLLRAANLVAQQPSRRGDRVRRVTAARNQISVPQMREGHRRCHSRARFAEADCGSEVRALSLSGPTTAATFSKCSASGRAWRRISQRNDADFRGAELSRHHQGIPLPPASDRLLDARAWTCCRWC